MAFGEDLPRDHQDASQAARAQNEFPRPGHNRMEWDELDRYIANPDLRAL